MYENSILSESMSWLSRQTLCLAAALTRSLLAHLVCVAIFNKARTPKQRIDRRPNLYATLLGSSVYYILPIGFMVFVDANMRLFFYAHIT